MTATLVFGGTFDPVHNGHIGSARALTACFDDVRLVMVPCQIPPHKSEPSVSGEDRFQMLVLAAEGEPDIEADDCELRREGISYTFDTLSSYRQQSADEPLYFVMGQDSWLTFTSWYRWREFCDLVHLIVLMRPGEAGVEDEPGDLVAWAESRRAELAETLQLPCGSVVPMSLEQYPVSATEVRRKLNNGESIAALVPEKVDRYIASRHLYL